MKFLTATSTIIFSIVFLTNGVWGQPLLVETFNYSDGQLTNAKNGANVSGGNWITNSGTGYFITVGGTGLTYNGYVNSAEGKKVTLTATTASAEDIYRQYTTQMVGIVYASFLINVANVTNLGSNTSVGNYFSAFLPSSSTTNYFARVVIRTGSSASKVNFGIIAVSGQTPLWITADYDVGTTHLLVFAYEFVSDVNNDVVKLWVDPPLTGVPDPDITQIASGTEPIDCARIAFRQGYTSGIATPNADISRIRIATSWGNTIPTSVKSQPSALPTKFALEQNYPNPFNPNTMLRFSLATDNHAVLKVYNLHGQEVATLFDGIAQEKRMYMVFFDAASLPSGVYIARLEQGGKQMVQKMVLIK